MVECAAKVSYTSQIIKYLAFLRFFEVRFSVQKLGLKRLNADFVDDKKIIKITQKTVTLTLTLRKRKQKKYGIQQTREQSRRQIRQIIKQGFKGR
ncbi:hypothetical protein MuYL_0840 [Mucilaginibacter xinganensis]|uniref:Uncharacterized protein n=1 Tax=Mucilaginibacter xinganensis TaxID=1234841 RepID=A0A223NSK5_9SPHI|nr:hypothetical protein MuYL_0840 [Mucilaginibacter xinganensis]